LKAYYCLPRQQVKLDNYRLMVIQEDHIESIRLWRNAQIDVLRQGSLISPKQQLEYFERNIWPTLSYEQPNNILMSLLYDNQLIGYGGLVHIGWEHSRAEVSFLLSPNRVKVAKLYRCDFTSFLRLIRQVAFNDLNLHRLYTETYDIRPLHIEILEANGFVREGVFNDHVRINGYPINSIFHGLLNLNEK